MAKHGKPSRRPERAQAARAAAPPPEALDPTAADRAAVALWLALAALVVVRGALSFVPSMAGWALNLQRFLPPWTWALWLASTLALVPPLARRLAPAVVGIGDAINERPGRVGLACALAAAILVLALPDRVRFVGDFLLRQGTVDEAGRPAILFPQALPLDLLFHYYGPLALAEAGLRANGAARLLGAVEAALLALLALAFARTLRLRGAAAVAAAAVVFFGGYLGMYTGFGKAFAELVLVAAALGVFGIGALRGGGLLPVGLALSIGILLHRSALAFAPAGVLLMTLWLRQEGARTEWRRPANLVGLVLPWVTAGVMLPKIIAIARRFDSVHFTPATVRLQGGPLAAALAGNRPLDFLNLVVMLSPLALAALALAALLLPGVVRRREGWVLVALALPFVLVAPFIHPAQGLFRDWDDFAATGMTLSLVAAWLVGETLRATPPRAWLGLAVLIGTAVSSIEWLVHHRDLDRGLARVEAFMRESPTRPPEERGTTWDYLGIRNEHEERYAAAAAAFAEAAKTSPSNRILLEWGMMETNAGNLNRAREVYRRAIALDSTSYTAWMGIAAVSSRLHDFPEARRAARKMLAITPNDENALNMLRYFDSVAPESAR